MRLCLIIFIQKITGSGFIFIADLNAQSESCINWLTVGTLLQLHFVSCFLAMKET